MALSECLLISRSYPLLKTKIQIPLFKFFCPPNIGKVVEEVFQSGFITEGEYSDRFEAKFARFVENDNCSLTNSCTSALVLACEMANLGTGDEVIGSPMTCMATNIPIVQAGAKIVWADIEPTTGNICPISVEKCVTPRTKAIVAVHWAGQPFDIDGIHAVAKKHNLLVIEDAAHALGASYNGQPIGTHSDYVCFSFQAIKQLTTADGGAITSKLAKDDQQIKKLRWFGLDRKFPGSRWKQDITDLGYKFHMNNVNAAIGLEQMKYVTDNIAKHIENGRYYDEHIENSKIITLTRDPKGSSSFWIYTILCEERDDLMRYLDEKGIASDIVHVRNDNYSVFKEFKKAALPGSDYFSSRMLNIPVGWWLSEEERRHIVATLNSF